jgi:hypothetical protein
MAVDEIGGRIVPPYFPEVIVKQLSLEQWKLL